MKRGTKNKLTPHEIELNLIGQVEDYQNALAITEELKELDAAGLLAAVESILSALADDIGDVLNLSNPDRRAVSGLVKTAKTKLVKAVNEALREKPANPKK